MPEWEQLPLAQLTGLVLLIGEPDSGKSTLARYLVSRLIGMGKKVVLVDGDPGQTSLGPPGTITAMVQGGAGENSVTSNTVTSKNVKNHAERRMWRWFIGSTAPTGHMLPMLVGASRLARAASSAGADAIIYDTCGLVSPLAGGAALKQAKIDLLQPSLVVAIQRQRELEHILQPLRRADRVPLFELPASPHVRSRSPAMRLEHRSAQYRSYFQVADLQPINWSDLAVFPSPHFRLNQLVGLESADGFLRGLGIVHSFENNSRQLTLLTPIPAMEKIDALHLGDLLVDIQTFRDTRIDAH